MSLKDAKLISNRDLETPDYMYIMILITNLLYANEDCKGRIKGLVRLKAQIMMLYKLKSSFMKVNT